MLRLRRALFLAADRVSGRPLTINGTGVENLLVCACGAVVYCARLHYPFPPAPELSLCLYKDYIVSRLRRALFPRGRPYVGPPPTIEGQALVPAIFFLHARLHYPFPPAPASSLCLYKDCIVSRLRRASFSRD